MPTDSGTPSAAGDAGIFASRQSTPISSMTGFAAARARADTAELSLSLRSVNHRGLDLHFHLPAELAPCEPAMRSILKGSLHRGHIEVRASVARDDQAIAFPAIDGRALDYYVTALREAARRSDLSFEPDLASLLTLPGVLGSSDRPSQTDLDWTPVVTAALNDCVRELSGCREREGKAMAAHILTELAGMESDVAAIAQLRADAFGFFHARLQSRLSELLGDTGVSATRLAEEAALLADRSDVQEEITRLQVHALELRRMVEEGGAVGKRLDFLIQELNRECNTVLSKTSGLGDAGLMITRSGLSIKARLEKIREQASNLE